MECPVQLVGVDHLVLTVRDVQATERFYTCIGMQAHREQGRHTLHFAQQKINLHAFAGEFQPAAAHPHEGSADLCLEVAGPMAAVLQHVHACALPVELGPVRRQGARGSMESLYLRDPDGNLIELAVYGA